MADLFAAIDALFTKADIPPEEVPSSWILHRFLASDKDYAAVARHVQPWVRGDDLIYAIWRVALPRSRKAPYFHYTAAKKKPAAAVMEARVMEVYGYPRAEAEEVLAMLTEPQRLELADYLGVDLEEETDGEAGSG